MTATFEIELERLRSFVDILEKTCDIVVTLIEKFGSEQSTKDGLLCYKTLTAAGIIVTTMREEMPAREIPRPSDQDAFHDLAVLTAELFMAMHWKGVDSVKGLDLNNVTKEELCFNMGQCVGIALKMRQALNGVGYHVPLAIGDSDTESP